MNKITDKQAKELREQYEKETGYPWDEHLEENYGPNVRIQYVEWLEEKAFNLLKP